MTEGRAGLRIKVLALLVVIMFAALSTRLWYLQVLASNKLKGQGQQQSIRIVEVPAPRGQILDDRGRVLVGNKMSLQVMVDRQSLGSNPNPMEARLSRVTGVPAHVIASRLTSNQYLPYTPVPVAFGISHDAAYYIDEHPTEFRGVSVTAQPVRTYPYGDLAAHVLGWTGQITAAQLKDPTYSNYSQTAIVGRDGIELWYEPQLQGTPGLKKYRVDAAGRNLGGIGSQPAVPGKSVKTSIDAKVQKLAEQSLQLGMQAARKQIDTSTNKYFRANAGAVVVMDPRTGAIIAMASNPTYNPELFVNVLTQAQYNKNFKRPSAGNPLLDRALQGQYPPGSSFKPFIAISALKNGVASTNGSYTCPPSWHVPGDPTTTFRNWAYPLNLGTMSLRTAIIESCDTVFYQLGYRYWSLFYPPTKPPKLPLQHDLSLFGFGKPTLIDVPGETNYGRVPTPQWVQQNYHQSPLPGDFVQMSIGQGYVLATPLQMADAYSAIANGGRLCVPHVAAQILNPDGSVAKTIKPNCRQLPFSQSDIGYVRSAMSGVVQYPGTAASAFTGFPFSKVSVAGKTGTAQIPGQQDASWFAAIASQGNRQYVVAALVEQGGHGSTTAAPVVRRIIDGMFGLGTGAVQIQPPKD